MSLIDIVKLNYEGRGQKGVLSDFSCLCGDCRGCLSGKVQNHKSIDCETSKIILMKSVQNRGHQIFLSKSKEL